jgi:hypothetical protein
MNLWLSGLPKKDGLDNLLYDYDGIIFDALVPLMVTIIVLLATNISG